AYHASTALPEPPRVAPTRSSVRAGTGRCCPLPPASSGPDDAVPARALGHHETDVGAGQDVGEALLVRAHPGAAGRDRGPDRRSVGTRDADLRKREADLVGVRHRLLRGRPIEDRDELLAAIAGDEVGSAEAGPEDVGEGPQDRVACVMPVLLVDRAEVIEVE